MCRVGAVSGPGGAAQLCPGQLSLWHLLEQGYCFTESQNNAGWKASLEVIQSTLVPKHGHLKQVTQECVQEGLGCPQTGRLKVKFFFM